MLKTKQVANCSPTYLIQVKMADAGFPTQHTTTTTATTTAEIRYDVSYIRTLPGLTKCICIVSIPTVST